MRATLRKQCRAIEFFPFFREVFDEGFIETHENRTFDSASLDRSSSVDNADRPKSLRSLVCGFERDEATFF